jgi:hypothetical protein
MSDEKGKPTPTNEVPGQDSRLTERLLSRGTDSLGLIDVRRVERHYARIMDWLAARTPLLAQLRTRYGVTEGEGLTGLAFAEPAGRESARVGDEVINLSTAPFSFTAPAAEPLFNTQVTEQIFTRVADVPDEPDAAPTGAKRIARRGVPTFSPASSEEVSDTGASQRREEALRQERGEAFKPALELSAPPREQARPNQDEARPNQEQARDLQSTSPAKETPAATVKNPSDESTSPHAQRTLPSIEERATRASAEQAKPLALGSNRTTEVEVVNNPTEAGGPRGAARLDAPRVIESPAHDALTPVPASRAQVFARERVNATAAPVVNEAEEVTLNRPGTAESSKAAAHAGVKFTVASETRAASESSASPPPLAHAREILEGDSGRASANVHAQTPLPLAPSQTAEHAEPARRQNNPAPAVTRASSSGITETFTPAHTRAQTRAEEVNVERLTEQVSRHLARRLLVERERRGLGRK